MYWWQKLSWWLLMSYKWKMYHEMYTRPTRLLIYRILWQVKNDKIVKSILQCFIYLFPSDGHYSDRKNATITLTALVGLVATRMVNAWNLAFYQMTAKKHQHTMEVIKSHQIWVKYCYTRENNVILCPIMCWRMKHCCVAVTQLNAFSCRVFCSLWISFEFYDFLFYWLMSGVFFVLSQKAMLKLNF